MRELLDDKWELALAIPMCHLAVLSYSHPLLVFCRQLR